MASERASDECLCVVSSRSETRSQESLMSSDETNVTDEGGHVSEQTGAVSTKSEGYSIISEFREKFDGCLQRIQESGEDFVTKDCVEELMKFVEDLWEQNSLLVETMEELERSSLCKGVDEELKIQTEQPEQVQSVENPMLDCNPDPESPGVAAIRQHPSALLDEQKTKVKFKVEDERNQRKQVQECGCQTNANLSGPDKGAELMKTVRNLQAEKDNLTQRVMQLTETMKEADNSYKETRWALTSEVAEKHDQIVELRNYAAGLEEKLRQADQQTHYKDDMIKHMRRELKTATARNLATPPAEPRGLYEVVTELKAVQRHESMQNMIRPCEETPQDQLDLLRQTLQKRMDDIEMQEEVTKELESDLKETRRELQVLQEKYHMIECQHGGEGQERLDRQDSQRAAMISKDSEKLAGTELEVPKAEICRQQDWPNGGQATLRDVQQLVSIAEREMVLLKEMEANTEGILKYLYQVHGANPGAEEMEGRLRGLAAEVGDTHSRLQQILAEVCCAVMAPTPSQKGQSQTQDRCTSPLTPTVEESMERIQGRVKMFQDRLKDFGDASTCSVDTMTEETDLCDGACGTVGLLSEKLTTQDQLLCNKEETLRLLQENLRIRENNNDALCLKIDDLESQVSSLTQCLEEKTTALSELQQLVHQQKQFELQMQVRDEQIESLQFDVCDLEVKHKMISREVIQRTRHCEKLQDENIDLRSELFTLHQDYCMMQADLKTSRRQRELEEKKTCGMRQELKAREQEVTDLRKKTKRLECEFQDKLARCEGQACHDADTITQLEVNIGMLQEQLRATKESCDITLSQAENQLRKQRTYATEKILGLEQRETHMSATLSQLKNEVKLLRKLEEDARQHEETQTKVTELETSLRQSEAKHQDYQEQINQQQTLIEQKTHEFETQRKKLRQELEAADSENFNNKITMKQLNETLKSQMQAEKNMKEYLEHYTNDLELLRTENAHLKADLESRVKELANIDEVTRVEARRIEKGVAALQAQKAEMRKQTGLVKRSLDEERQQRTKLEEDMERAKESLAQQMMELNAASQKQKQTSEKLQQALIYIHKMEDELQISKNAATMGKERAEDIFDKLGGIIRKENKEKKCLQMQVQKRETELLELDKQIQIHEGAVEELRQEINTLKSRHRSEVQQLTEQVHVARRVAEDLEVELGRAKEQLRQVSEREASLLEEKTRNEGEWGYQLREAELERSSLEQHLQESVQQLERLQNEVQHLTKKLHHCQQKYDSLNMDRQTDTEKLSFSDKLRANYEQMLTRVNAERMCLGEENNKLHDALVEAQLEVGLLKDKMSGIRLAESEKQALLEDKERMATEKKKLACQVQKLSDKVHEFEVKLIPNLEKSLAQEKEEVKDLKDLLAQANGSCDRMRSEAESVMAISKKNLALQKSENESLRARIKAMCGEKAVLAKEIRDLEERLKGLVRMNDHLMSEVHGRISRTPSASSWVISRSQRDASSPEFLESGFQSMQPSPTDLYEGGFTWQMDLGEEAAMCECHTSATGPSTQTSHSSSFDK